MKILCVCHSGNVRSVTLARLLKKRGHEAIGVGLKQKTLLPILLEWADRVYPMDYEVASALSPHPVDVSYAIGHDDWKVPDHPDLLRRLRDLVEAHPPEP